MSVWADASCVARASVCAAAAVDEDRTVCAQVSVDRMSVCVEATRARNSVCVAVADNRIALVWAAAALAERAV